MNWRRDRFVLTPDIRRGYKDANNIGWVMEFTQNRRCDSTHRLMTPTIQVVGVFFWIEPWSYSPNIRSGASLTIC